MSQPKPGPHGAVLHRSDCICVACEERRAEKHLEQHGPRGFADKVAGDEAARQLGEFAGRVLSGVGPGACTKAERELIESHLRWFSSTDLETTDDALTARQAATVRVLAERQPKTPEQVFEERIRYVLLSFDAYSERWENDDHKQSLQWASAAHKLRAALGALDHARAELKRGTTEGKRR